MSSKPLAPEKHRIGVKGEGKEAPPNVIALTTIDHLFENLG
jgi:hypothetical protein